MTGSHKHKDPQRGGGLSVFGAQKRSGFVATLLTLTAFGHAKARRDSLNLHLLT